MDKNHKNNPYLLPQQKDLKPNNINAHIPNLTLSKCSQKKKKGKKCN